MTTTSKKSVQNPPADKKASSRAVFFVSDGTGITAETLGKGLLSQFNGINFRQLRFPFVDSPEKAAECQLRIREAREQDGVRPLVAMTLMDPAISAMLRAEDALFLDLFEVFIAPLEKELGVRSAHTVGRSHGQSSNEYANRIAAMSFAIAHDDGVTDANLKNADVILVGVSRSGKTPTSLYLSMQFGLRAANYPLIPEDFERGRLPEALLPFRNKLFGLTIAPEQLHRIREERRPESKYAALDTCREEVAAAERMMLREGIEWFDMTSRSIEEVAVRILQAINRKK
ncbi:MAG TPA: pyruvate, water dikinase regulatory protein [Gallionella sp.]|nr:pyruvate, water dikinase regulatory protein [Gallionella sp.]